MDIEKVYQLKQNARFAGAGNFDAAVDQVLKDNLPKSEIIIPETTIRGNKVSGVMHLNQDDKGNHHLNAFTITMVPKIQIFHGVINGIDTRELDAKMAKADWSLFPDDNKLDTFTNDQMTKAMRNLTLMEDVARLSEGNSKEGLQIQEQLAVKHWQGTPFADLVPRFDSLVAAHQRPAITQTFPTQYNERYNLYEAVALLTPGGAVHKQIIPFRAGAEQGQDNTFPQESKEAGKGELADMRPFKAWVVIDFRNTKDNGQFWKRFLHKEYFDDPTAQKPDYNMAGKLNEFDLLELRTPAIYDKKLQSIEAGNPTLFHYEKNGDRHEVYVTANPTRKTVNFLDLDGNFIKHELIPKYSMEKIHALQNNLSSVGAGMREALQEKMQPTGATHDPVQQAKEQLQEASASAAVRSEPAADQQKGNAVTGGFKTYSSDKRNG